MKNHHITYDFIEMISGEAPTNMDYEVTQPLVPHVHGTTVRLVRTGGLGAYTLNRLRSDGIYEPIQLTGAYTAENTRYKVVADMARIGGEELVRRVNAGDAVFYYDGFEYVPVDKNTDLSDLVILDFGSITNGVNFYKPV